MIRDGNFFFYNIQYKNTYILQTNENNTRKSKTESVFFELLLKREMSISYPYSLSNISIFCCHYIIDVSTKHKILECSHLERKT